MTFLEFFEALIGCAEIFATDAVVKDPTTPRPSTVLTQDPSVYSMPASPSRMTSQVCTPHPSTVLAPGSLCLLHAHLTVTHDLSGMYPPLPQPCYPFVISAPASLSLLEVLAENT